MPFNLPAVNFWFSDIVDPIGHIQCGCFEPSASERLIVKRIEEFIVVQFTVTPRKTLHIEID